MDSAEAIKQRLAESFPFVFQRTPSIDVLEFRSKYAEVTKYAHKMAESFLGEDTIRYQSILMSVSLLSVLIYALNLKKVEFLKQNIRIDTTFLFLLAVFVASVSVIFIAKSYLDYKTRQLERHPQSGSVNAVMEIIKTGQLKEIIDRYYWNKAFNLIGQTWGLYMDAYAATRNEKSDFQHIEIPQVYDLDIEGLKSHEPLRDAIEAHEESFQKIAELVEADCSKFKEKVADIPLGDFNSVTLVQTAFDETLQKWFDARNELGREALNIMLEGEFSSRSVELVQKILARARRIRRAVLVVEVVFPVLFAVAAISLFWLA